MPPKRKCLVFAHKKSLVQGIQLLRQLISDGNSQFQYRQEIIKKILADVTLRSKALNLGHIVLKLTYIQQMILPITTYRQNWTDEMKKDVSYMLTFVEERLENYQEVVEEEVAAIQPSSLNQAMSLEHPDMNEKTKIFNKSHKIHLMSKTKTSPQVLVDALALAKDVASPKSTTHVTLRRQMLPCIAENIAYLCHQLFPRSAKLDQLAQYLYQVSKLKIAYHLITPYQDSEVLLHFYDTCTKLESHLTLLFV